MGKTYTFEDQGRTCRILDPRPPRYWFNYLWSERGYCAQVSQMGHGRSYYLNEKADMCRINNNDARYFYLRDEADRDAWNIGMGPMRTPVEEYACEHSIGYSRIHSRHRGIFASWRIFVPEDAYNEVWTVTIRNESDQTRVLSLFSAVTFELEGFSYPRYYEMYRCLETSFDRELGGIYCASRHPFAPHRRYNAYLASSEPVCGWDGDLSRFCGATGSITKLDASAYALFQQPEVVVSGADCTNSDAALFILGAVLQHRLTLLPGEMRELQFVFGVSESMEEARQVQKKYATREQVETAFERAVRYNLEKYASLQAVTPDEKINNIMNLWLKKQIDCCLVGKKGVRDNLQIAVAMLNFRPEKAREEILECLRHQYRDGHAVLTWYPLDETRYSDQPFWIIWAVCELLKECGDFSILDRRIPWQDGGEDAVWRHLQAAAACLLGDKGPHGLMKLRFADWNDALNVTTDPDAESVMLSHQTCLALRELAVLAEQKGDGEYAASLIKERENLVTAINTHAWDGAWYLRALSREEPVGSQNSMGSKLYLNAQTWAILADVVPRDRLQQVIDAVDSMEHDFGFPLNTPPYTEYSPHVGRMSGMLPGEFENGGVYCHATGFKILMDCALGRGDEAIRTLKKIMPDSDLNPSTRSGAEPYVFTNCYSTHPKYYGRSYWSWTTGTSAWAMMCLYEGILGARRDYAGLRLEPNLPKDWDHAELTRTFRGTEYHITYQRRKRETACGEHCREKMEIIVDGKVHNGDQLPVFADGKRHEVRVNL